MWLHQRAMSTEDYHTHTHLQLQGYIRGWLIRRKWKRVIHDYLESPEAAMMKTRNQVQSLLNRILTYTHSSHVYIIHTRAYTQLMWKFVASEEDYVSQLAILSEEFKQHCEIASLSRNPPLTLEQCNIIFRNRCVYISVCVVSW